MLFDIIIILGSIIIFNYLKLFYINIMHLLYIEAILDVKKIFHTRTIYNILIIILRDLIVL
jgi:hypothetical protein